MYISYMYVSSVAYCSNIYPRMFIRTNGAHVLLHVVQSVYLIHVRVQCYLL